MSPQKVIIADSLEQTLTQAVGECEHDRIFLLADETTVRACVPLIAGFDCLKGAQTIVIGATDTHKT